VAARRQHTVVRRGPKRGTFWFGSTSTALANVSAAAPANQVLIAEATLENVPNPTLIRTRGCWYVRNTIASSVGTIGIGIKIVDAVAFAAGALPLPLTNIDDDWLVWSCTTLRGTGTGIEHLPYERVEIDSKAMRKVGENEVAVIVWEVVSVLNVPVIETAISLRVLLKK